MQLQTKSLYGAEMGISLQLTETFQQYQRLLNNYDYKIPIDP
tara:strand:- start:489 stop:614 length:126 start_codon:yes stop_codon:yes gene_type:complete